ncbi:hypothetical protein PIB30_017486 [Stylosanthes scabra]|uniref:Uncharacterized protein n=1 Tax=Stylosanthes scabra TaxID=79078 RepID=A0ABU6Q7F2_9FABA|nr:hypothetical protein [Stylosanthes scabra]
MACLIARASADSGDEVGEELVVPVSKNLDSSLMTAARKPNLEEPEKEASTLHFVHSLGGGCQGNAEFVSQTTLPWSRDIAKEHAL